MEGKPSVGVSAQNLTSANPFFSGDENTVFFTRHTHAGVKISSWLAHRIDSLLKKM